MHRSQPRARLVAVLLALGFATGTTDPCSTFVLRDGEQVVFGKNYDWHVDEGLVFVNQRGVARRSMAASGEDPAAWVSRFGSVTVGRGSLERFAIAARRVRDFEASGPHDGVAYAFDTLLSVAQPASTQWSIVYEQTPDATRLHFRTRRSPEVKTVDLSRLEFGCSGSVLWLDMHREAGGDVTASFRPYSVERNLELVGAAYRKTRFLTDTPSRVIERVAHHPATSRCVP